MSTGIANTANATMKTTAAIVTIKITAMTVMQIAVMAAAIMIIMPRSATDITTGMRIIMTGMPAGRYRGITGASIADPYLVLRSQGQRVAQKL